ncbi:MAG: amidohydrolase family protein, partial [Acidimicrobiia bacterium]
CSPFSVTPDLMSESAALARAMGTRLHTHLAETLDEESFCQDMFGKRAVQHAEDLGWAGSDVWFAHGVYIDDSEIERMAIDGTGVAHCPTSNMRLASGIAPVRKFLAAGVPVGLGVDGSASNDGSHLLAEARQAMLLARLDAAPNQSDGELMTARQALEIATLGGATVLGRSDIGSLEKGKTADFISIDLDQLGYAGAQADPVAAAVFSAPVNVSNTYVHGQAVVSNGRLVNIEMEPLIERHNALARSLLNG